MPRIRTFKPEITQDEKLAPQDATTRLVFMLLVLNADDRGRLVDAPRYLDGLFFTHRADESCEPSLTKLHTLGMIERGFTESGQRVIQIVNWEKHQKIDRPNFQAALPAIVRPLVAPAADRQLPVEELSTSDRRAGDEAAPSHTYDLRPTTDSTEADASGSDPKGAELQQGELPGMPVPASPPPTPIMDAALVAARVAARKEAMGLIRASWAKVQVGAWDMVTEGSIYSELIKYETPEAVNGAIRAAILRAKGKPFSLRYFHSKEPKNQEFYNQMLAAGRSAMAEGPARFAAGGN